MTQDFMKSARFHMKSARFQNMSFCVMTKYERDYNPETPYNFSYYINQV